MEEFEEGILDTGLLISAMVKRSKQIKLTHEEGFNKGSLCINVPTRDVVWTRKQSGQTKSDTSLKNKNKRGISIKEC